LAPLAFRQESFVVLLSITPLLDGVLRLDIIAPFHTSGPPLLQFHLAIEQWGTNTIGSRTTRTEAYPLPYSEFCLPIVSGKGYVGGLNYGFGVGVTNFGLTSVTIANNSEDSSYRWTGYTYIVVGA